MMLSNDPEAPKLTDVYVLNVPADLLARRTDVWRPCGFIVTYERDSPRAGGT